MLSQAYEKWPENESFLTITLTESTSKEIQNNCEHVRDIVTFLGRPDVALARSRRNCERRNCKRRNKRGEIAVGEMSIGVVVCYPWTELL